MNNRLAPTELDRGVVRPAATMPALLVCALAMAGAAGPESASDEGSSELAPLAAESLLLDGATADGLTVAVGERGHMLISDDAGTHWTQVRVPTRATLTGVFFLDRDHGWAVGHDEVILRTEDGGRHWRLMHSAPQNKWPLLDVLFLDRNHGIAVGAYSRYLVTRDGGDSWTEQTFEPVTPGKAVPDDDEFFDSHLNAIVRASGQRLYIAGEAGKLFRSDDAGGTWQTLPSPYEGSFYGVLPLSQDGLLAFGLRGHLFRSNDGGMSWVQLQSGTEAMLTDGVRINQDTIALVGLAGTMTVSEDGGARFTATQQPDRRGISRILKAGEGFILLGEGGARRHDAGTEAAAGAPP